MHGFGVPGVNNSTRLTVPEEYAGSSTIILDVPVSDLRVTLEHPTENTQTLPGLVPTALDWPRVRWLVRDGVPTGGRGTDPRWLDPVPDATPTTGEVHLGQDVAMITEAGAGLIQLTNVDEVPAYPGLEPEPGHVFVEVLVRVRDLGKSLLSLARWRAVGADGQELAIIHDAYGAEQRRGVLSNMISETESRDAWFVIEAPASGAVRLEYRHEDLLDQMFWIQLRD